MGVRAVRFRSENRSFWDGRDGHPEPDDTVALGLDFAFTLQNERSKVQRPIMMMP